MNEIQKIFAKRVLPLNINYIREYVPELHDKIPKLEKRLEEILVVSKLSQTSKEFGRAE